MFLQAGSRAPKESRGTEKKSTAPTLAERKLQAEEELRELKAQLEEAGFSSVSHIRQEPGMWELMGGRGAPHVLAAACPSQHHMPPRKAMLSLCLENAELKERMGEATSLLESGEQEEAGLGNPPSPEPCRMQRKGRNVLGDGQGLLAERGAMPTKRPALEAQCQDDAPKRLCPSSTGGGDGSHVSAAAMGLG